ncbi:MAG: PDZ domain-containing protein, partial [Clostridia bacterium]|nr:PDZ domain-containing protein [Clostridia bacterium]
MTSIKFKKALCVVLLFSAVCVFAGAEYDAGETAAASAGERQSLYIGGVPFGVRIYRDGVSVVGVSGDAVHEDEEGLKTGDVIYQINGRKTASVADLTAAVRSSGGETAELTVGRGGEIIRIKV